MLDSSLSQRPTVPDGGNARWLVGLYAAGPTGRAVARYCGIYARFGKLEKRLLHPRTALLQQYRNGVYRWLFRAKRLVARMTKWEGRDLSCGRYYALFYPCPWGKPCLNGGCQPELPECPC